jgi:hypothetical protein
MKKWSGRVDSNHRPLGPEQMRDSQNRWDNHQYLVRHKTSIRPGEPSSPALAHHHLFGRRCADVTMQREIPNDGKVVGSCRHAHRRFACRKDAPVAVIRDRNRSRRRSGGWVRTDRTRSSFSMSRSTKTLPIPVAVSGSKVGYVFRLAERPPRKWTDTRSGRSTTLWT